MTRKVSLNLSGSSSMDRNTEYQEVATSRVSMLANLAASPTTQAALAIADYSQGFGELNLVDLVAALTNQTTTARNDQGNTAEAMLIAQAHTLDAIFNRLARTAIKSKYLDHFETYLKLSLRAQSQCKATWEAASAI